MSENKINDIVNQLSSLTVLEAADLAKALEEKWNVSAALAAPVAASAVAAQGSEAAEEKTEFNVTLESYDEKKKIAAIKEVRAVTGLGLKEAKDLVEGAPKLLKESVSKEEAEEIKSKFEAAGAKVKID